MPLGSRIPTAPGRSPEQRQRALAKANEVRLARAQLKRAVAAGRIELARLLSEPPNCLHTAKARDLLLVVPGIGPARADRLLAHCRIAHTKTLHGLSERQRGELIDQLGDRRLPSPSNGRPGADPAPRP